MLSYCFPRTVSDVKVWIKRAGRIIVTRIHCFTTYYSRANTAILGLRLSQWFNGGGIKKNLAVDNSNDHHQSTCILLHFSPSSSSISSSHLPPPPIHKIRHDARSHEIWCSLPLPLKKFYCKNEWNQILYL